MWTGIGPAPPPEVELRFFRNIFEAGIPLPGCPHLFRSSTLSKVNPPANFLSWRLLEKPEGW
jgi:hypothetical protein